MARFWKLPIWHHPIHRSQLLGALIQCAIVIIASILVVECHAEKQAEADRLKTKQEVLRSFSTSITLTLNSHTIKNNYFCKMIHADSKTKKIEFSNLYEEYYKKVCSLDPPYEVACKLVELHFNGQIVKDVKQFEKDIKDYLQFVSAKNENCIYRNKEWQVSDPYRTVENALWDKYDKLINNMIAQIKLGGIK